MTRLPTKAIPERERLARLHDSLENSVRLAVKYYAAIARRDPEVINASERARGVEDVDTIMEALAPHIADLATILRASFIRAHASEADALAGRLRKAVFEPDAEAIRIMNDRELAFIVEFSDSQRDAVRQALVKALTQGKGSAVAARAFRDSIGLTAYQQGVVDNYRRLLENNSTAALDRVLRDRRSDDKLQSAIDSGDPLSSTQIDRMVDRYAARYLAMRADTIARTETIGVLNEARREAFRQTMEGGGIDPETVTRTWEATSDNRTRDTHAAMDGQVRGVDEPFDSPSGEQLMYPGDPDASAEEVVNCRCTLTYNIAGG